VQIVVCTITGDADEFALAFAAKAKKRGLRVETDLRNGKINYKVREHSLAEILAFIAVGRRARIGCPSAGWARTRNRRWARTT
jgi:threonyl-tRNA synthetase